MESIIQDVMEREVGKDAGRNVYDKGVAQQFSNDEDAELAEIVARIPRKIKVVGAGGAGCNTIVRLKDIGIDSAAETTKTEMISVNTDAQDLLCKRADKKLLIGKNITHGLGAGNDPDVGEKCAKEDFDKIKNALEGANMVFLAGGLGGGTGTGSLPVIAEIAKNEIKALTIAVVTIPFKHEGTVRALNALGGLKKLRKAADTVIVIPNDRLMDMVPHLPLNRAFAFADEILANAVKGITEMITKDGLVNLDFADLRAVMTQGKTAVIGFGEAAGQTDSGERSIKSVESAIKSPLIDADISNANRALINIIGGPDMTLEEAQDAVKLVSESISPGAQIIWGAQIDDKGDRNTIRTLLVITGVETIPFEEELEMRSETKMRKTLGQHIGKEI